MKYSIKAGYSEIVFKSPVLIKNLFIHSEENWLKFDDNGFDLLPNIEKTVKVLKGDISKSLKFISLYDSYTAND